MSIDYRKIPLGMLDDKHLKTDYNLATIGVMKDEDYPKEVKPIIKHKIYDQGQTSMCFAFTMARVVETQHYLETGEQISVSEGAIYANKFTGFGGEGMIPIFDLDLFRKFGAIEKSDFNITGTYDLVKAEYDKLNQSVINEKAKKLRALTWLRLDTTEIIPYLHLWKGACISVDVFESFYATNSTGIIANPSGANYGGHAMYVDEAGVDSLGQYVCGDNSWGEAWGNKGRFKIYLNNPCIKAFYGLVDVNPITNQVELTIGSKVMITAKGNVELPEAPIFYKSNPDSKIGTTMIPLRVITELFGKRVTWIPSDKPNGIDSRIVIDMPKNVSDMLII